MKLPEGAVGASAIRPLPGANVAGQVPLGTRHTPCSSDQLNLTAPFTGSFTSGYLHNRALVGTFQGENGSSMMVMQGQLPEYCAVTGSRQVLQVFLCVPGISIERRCCY